MLVPPKSVLQGAFLASQVKLAPSVLVHSLSHMELEFRSLLTHKTAVNETNMKKDKKNKDKVTDLSASRHPYAAT